MNLIFGFPFISKNFIIKRVILKLGILLLTFCVGVSGCYEQILLQKLTFLARKFEWKIK